MSSSFVNRKDRIIASAIEIISESGLSSLTTKMLASKEGMSESLLYRYFGGIDEVLVEVVNTYTKFDERMIATISAKNIPHIDKAKEFLTTLSVYYDGYKEIGAIVLNYEEFLHDVNTRDKISHSIEMRTEYVKQEIQAAIDAGEIIDSFTPDELALIFFGTLSRDLLNRRIHNESVSHDKVAESVMDKILNRIRIEN